MHTGIIHHYIGGQVVEGASGRYADVYNPALGEPCARVALASSDEVNAAVRAASEAFPAWAAMPALGRARVLFKYLQLCQQHTDDFARMVTLEHGKTFSDARGEVARGMAAAAMTVDRQHRPSGRIRTVAFLPFGCRCCVHRTSCMRSVCAPGGRCGNCTG